MIVCIVDDCDNPVENRDNGLCATHNKLSRKKVSQPKKKKRIRLASKKHVKDITEYVARKKEFFKKPKNNICCVCGQKGVDSIHHTKGKVGYADEWARENGISLLNDTRFWAPIHSFVSNPRLGEPCHRYIETHDEFAREIGLKLTRSVHEKEK